MSLTKSRHQADTAEHRRGSNLFDALRIIAAAMVIWGHAWPLSGVSGAPTVAGVKIHHLGVYIFFIISGFLLTRSWERGPRPFGFLLRRALRIFPALYAVLVITVFILGPLLSTQASGGYWGAESFWRYFLNFFLFATYDLPGVFLTNPTSAVNGSLWSLGPEFCCYLALTLIGRVGSRASVFTRVVVALAIVSVVFAVPMVVSLRTTAIAVLFFALGSLMADIVKKCRCPLWPILITVPVLVIADGNAGLLAMLIVLPYVVVAVGNSRSKIGKYINRVGDPSYGMYLSGFVLQQILIGILGTPVIGTSIAIVLPAAIAFGLMSWHLIEKHAIRLGEQFR